MLKLKTRLALFNLSTKLAFTAIFILVMPYIIQRITLTQTDNILVEQREKVIALIEAIGIDPFISEGTGTSSSFGSYNILKEEYVSIEKADTLPDINDIEVATRVMENEEREYRVLKYTITVENRKYLIEVGKSLETIKQTQKNTSVIILLFIGSIILITFLADFQYTRLILKPLDRITSKLKGISDPASFDKSPVQTGTEDFRNLDDALRDLIANIESLLQKEKEITTNISHELLTPVSILKSRIENLLLQHSSDAKTEEWAEQSLRTIQKLQSMVNSLMLIARIESSQYIKNDSVKVEILVSEVIADLTFIAEDSSIELTHDLEASDRELKANIPLLTSMFVNVLKNALSNTGRDGYIKVKGRNSNNSYIIDIEDNGKGMTQEQLSLLFERFRGRGLSKEEGAGIGLAIAKTVADFHSIDISVKSEPSKGTSFTFSIPL